MVIVNGGTEPDLLKKYSVARLFDLTLAGLLFEPQKKKCQATVAGRLND
jgi:hypothetical protein